MTASKGGRLPDFLVIGAMKAGTTSLHHYLAAHPQVFMPKVKELDFFTEELGWARGWDWYRRQFSAADADIKAVGEASTSYTKYPRYPGSAKLIGRHLPDARLIYVVRLNSVYIDYSRYAMQIERYLEFFDRSQMLLLTSEGLRFSRGETIRSVLAFIGVDEDETIGNLDEEFYRTEDRPAYGRILGSTRRMLKKRFPHAVGLWRGRFLPPWLKKRLGRPEGIV